MRIRPISLALLLLASCLVPTTDQPDASSAIDGGSADGGANTRCLEIFGLNQTVCVTLTPVVCGGRTCGAGEVCCQTTGACVLPGASTCIKPTSTSTPNSTPCASNADCGSGQYCVPDDYRAPMGGLTQRCISPTGYCQDMALCGFCTGDVARCRVCGCNGVTYASPQEACVAGVWSANRGACGAPSNALDGGAFTIACGTSDQCPAGAQCCSRTGKCFDASEPWRCEVQPNGSILNCASHGECNVGAGGGNGSDDNSLCAADGCGGPGLCTFRPSIGDCGGAVQQVCGCDNVTYVNACWARSAGTRVAHDGPCP